MSLKVGDYITHIDHGIGKFMGLVKVTNDGKTQECFKLTYKNNDLLYVSIHSLHKISKYNGPDGREIVLNKLGSPTWKTLKQKTKAKVKQIAFDLIKLYAQRKTAKGFSFSPDSYLQNELEASFIYEDTPDQEKATQDVKNDMENDGVMDRLICGDVGFGKTEVAIRAAFKAATDGKQVAVLVPTTILAFQHYRSFKERLKDFPVSISYLNRFRSTKQKNETKEGLKNGKMTYNGDKLLPLYIAEIKRRSEPLTKLSADEENKLGMRMVGHLKAGITFGGQFGVIPSVLYQAQSGAKEIVVGSDFGYYLNNANFPATFFLGAGYRLDDAVIASVGMDYKNFRFGASYDINTSTLKEASAGKGGFELSLVYTGCILPVIPTHYVMPCPRY